MLLYQVSSVLYLRQSAVVPDITVMREAIVNETQLPLLFVLFDWVQFVLRRDLFTKKRFS